MFIVCGFNLNYYTTTTTLGTGQPTGLGLSLLFDSYGRLILIKNHVIIKYFKYSPFLHVSFHALWRLTLVFTIVSYSWVKTELWNVCATSFNNRKGEIVSWPYINAVAFTTKEHDNSYTILTTGWDRLFDVLAAQLKKHEVRGERTRTGDRARQRQRDKNTLPVAPLKYA